MKYLLAILTSCMLGTTGHAQHPIISSAIQEVNLDSLIFRVEEITGMRGVTLNGTTDTIFSRHKNKPGNARAFAYFLHEFTELGLQVDSLNFGTLGKNIWAVQPGLVYPNQYYILCAHYDGMPNANIAPAADDNGGSCATVLEAARILSQYAFEYTIVYALWDEEEQGLVGSNKYATDALSRGDSIRGVLNMDAISWDGDNDSLARVHTKPIANSLALSDTLLAVNTAYQIGLQLAINNPGATYSDHASFWNKGYSAVLLIEDFDNDPNPHYHTATDSLTYFNLPYYHKLSRLAIGSLGTLAVPVGYLDAATTPDTWVRIYPNPVSEVLSIDLNNPAEKVEIRLYDMTGKMAAKHCVKNTQTIRWDISGTTTGIYTAYLRADGKICKFKIAVERP